MAFLTLGVFEIGVLLCFATAWFANIWKAYRARAAAGMSLPFMIIIEIGYICGMLNKTINQDVNNVVAFYVFNFYPVFIGIPVYFWNLKLDGVVTGMIRESSDIRIGMQQDSDRIPYQKFPLSRY